jgi:hypothetical protein
MLWSGIVSFVILVVMELVIQGYRHLKGSEEPPFQLVLDKDIIIDDEIGEEFLVTEGSGTVDDGLELAEIPRPVERVQELHGADARLPGPGSSASVSLGSRGEA